MFTLRIAVGIVLSAPIVFFSTIGVATVVWDRPLGSLVPSSSADIASWMQAIGSVGAIFASYFIGARQARTARESALELYRMDRARVVEGCRAVVMQMDVECQTMASAVRAHDGLEFKSIWDSVLKASVEASLSSFDSLPIHEIGSGVAIPYAFEIRQQVAHLIVKVDQIVVGWQPPTVTPGQMPQPLMRFEEAVRTEHEALRNVVNRACVVIKKLSEAFMEESAV